MRATVTLRPLHSDRYAPTVTQVTRGEFERGPAAWRQWSDRISPKVEKPSGVMPASNLFGLSKPAVCGVASSNRKQPGWVSAGKEALADGRLR